MMSPRSWHLLKAPGLSTLSDGTTRLFDAPLDYGVLWEGKRWRRVCRPQARCQSVYEVAILENPFFRGYSERLPARWLLWAVNSPPQVAPCAVLRFDKRWCSHAACVWYDAVCWADALLCIWCPHPSEWVVVDSGLMPCVASLSGMHCGCVCACLLRLD